MPVYDSLITLTPKATSPTETVVPKGTMPYTQKVPKPYPIDVLALLAENGRELLAQNNQVLTVQGAF